MIAVEEVVGMFVVVDTSIAVEEVVGKLVGAVPAGIGHAKKVAKGVAKEVVADGAAVVVFSTGVGASAAMKARSLVKESMDEGGEKGKDPNHPPNYSDFTGAKTEEAKAFIVLIESNAASGLNGSQSQSGQLDTSAGMTASNGASPSLGGASAKLATCAL